MSIRFEGCGTDARVDAVPGGLVMGEYILDGPTLVIQYDEVFYIEGSSREDLRAFLTKALDAVNALICDNLPPIVEVRARDVEVGDALWPLGELEDEDDPRVVAAVTPGDQTVYTDQDGDEYELDGDQVLRVRKAITLTWHQPRVEPFDEADFYDVGNVATVTGRDGYAITVLRTGRSELHLDKPESERDGNLGDHWCIRSAEEFRQHFPDGVIPDEGVEWENNGWFDLSAEDAVAHSLKEAVNDAIGRVKARLGLLGGEEGW